MLFQIATDEGSEELFTPCRNKKYFCLESVACALPVIGVTIKALKTSMIIASAIISRDFLDLMLFSFFNLSMFTKKETI